MWTKDFRTSASFGQSNHVKFGKLCDLGWWWCTPSIQVPPRVLVQAATPLADSPSEEREDALFCSFDDSPLSQVLPMSPL